MDHWVEEWLYYNFAAESFHTKTLCSRLYSIKKSLFEPPLGDLGDIEDIEKVQKGQPSWSSH